jgi:transposase
MGKFECDICNKNFDSEGSLEQHNKAKHSSEKKKISFKPYFMFIVLIIAILIIAYAFYLRSQKEEYDEFAKCLTEKGVVVYGNDFCSYTAKQLNMFGKSERYLSYVKCINNKELCDNKGIDITPTWEINGEKYSGVQSLEHLATLTGCEL